MADRRRRRRQNSNDSVVESEDEGVGDEADEADGQPIPRAAGRDYYQLVFDREGAIPDSAATSVMSTSTLGTPTRGFDQSGIVVHARNLTVDGAGRNMSPRLPDSTPRPGDDSEEFESANEGTHEDDDETESEDESDDEDDFDPENAAPPAPPSAAPTAATASNRTPLAPNLQVNNIERPEIKVTIPLMTSPLPDPAAKRERGDGMEHPPGGSAVDGVRMSQGSAPLSPKDLDDDEDRRNPAFIPRRGNFYEHDDRQDEEDGEQTGPAAMVPPNVPPALSGSAGRADWGPNQGAPSQRNNRENMRGTNPEVNSELRGSKGVAGGKPGTTGRWYHDMYNEDDQAPKSRQELIAYYGYDPRTRDSPPPITQVRVVGAAVDGGGGGGGGRGRGMRRNKPHRFGEFTPPGNRDIRERGAINNRNSDNNKSPASFYQAPERRSDPITRPGMGEHLRSDPITRPGMGEHLRSEHLRSDPITRPGMGEHLRSDPVTRPGMGEHLTRGSVPSYPTEPRRSSPQKTPLSMTQTTTTAAPPSHKSSNNAPDQYPPLRSSSGGPASVIPLMTGSATSTAQNAPSPPTAAGRPGAAAPGNASPPTMQATSEASPQVNNSSASNQDRVERRQAAANPIHQQQQEDGEAGLSKGYMMQRRSGRGQTAGTGRARGSASGIGEAASSGDSRSGAQQIDNVQRRLQNLSMGSPSPTDIPAASPQWPGGVAGGSVGGRPLRGAHGQGAHSLQQAEAIGSGRGGGSATNTNSRHAQQPGSGRFSAQGPPPKAGTATSTNPSVGDRDEAGRAALNKRYSSQRGQRERGADEGKDPTPPPHSVPGHVSKLSPLGVSGPRPIVKDQLSPSTNAFTPQTQFISPSVHPSVSPAMTTVTTFTTPHGGIVSAQTMVAPLASAPTALYPVSTVVPLNVAPAPPAFYSGPTLLPGPGAPGTIVTPTGYHPAQDLHSTQLAAAAHAQNAAVAAMAQSNPMETAMYTPAPAPAQPQAAPLPNPGVPMGGSPADPNSMAAAAAAYMLAYAAAGGNPQVVPSPPQPQPVGLLPQATMDIQPPIPVESAPVSAPNYIGSFGSSVPTSVPSSSEVVHGGTTYYSNPVSVQPTSHAPPLYHPALTQDPNLIQGTVPMISSPPKRVSALAAKLPLKAIPIVDPNFGTDQSLGETFDHEEGAIAFDPSISEFVPQSAMTSTTAGLGVVEPTTTSVRETEEESQAALEVRRLETPEKESSQTPE